MFLLFEGNASFNRSLYQAQKNPQLWAFSAGAVKGGRVAQDPSTELLQCAPGPGLASAVTWAEPAQLLPPSRALSSLALRSAAPALAGMCHPGHVLSSVAPSFRHL